MYSGAQPTCERQWENLTFCLSKRFKKPAEAQAELDEINKMRKCSLSRDIMYILVGMCGGLHRLSVTLMPGRRAEREAQLLHVWRARREPPPEFRRCASSLFSSPKSL